ncbi:flavodoxin [Candidatus Thiothrix sp. Deng01]|uniref:Flavodoxin n=1 Tax=Candidatus Thiothrix phosphatis TaxID=3112415 RepID=A0ABU6D275_9GAMM|nr:flavodoxin [Candidatus Thiothrix sp. Deng01]MEB4593174.1 flavodoxin [Candidatus Thiothrix sp. Deng01]
MNKIGIFFGTDSGTTRLMAKKMSKLLGDAAAKPVNVNRSTADDLLQYDALILGTPSYGINQLPGKSTKVADGCWEEFMPQLQGADLSGKTIALYGLGDQEKYPDRFAHSLIHLYDWCVAGGADVIGRWSTEGYAFDHSPSVVDGEFVGLILDQRSQSLLTDERLAAWINRIKPTLLAKLAN